MAACVALLLAPVQKRLSAAFGGRATLAAALLVLFTTVVILVPVLTSLFLLARQFALFLEWIRAQPLLGPEELQRFWEQLPQRYPGLRAWVAWLQRNPRSLGRLSSSSAPLRANQVVRVYSASSPDCFECRPRR